MIVERDYAPRLFASNKYLPYTALLARQYTKLVADKAGAGDATTLPSPWPEVEGLDFNGVTNWIVRCKKRDANFVKGTLELWTKQREARSKQIRPLLQKWQAPKAPARITRNHPGQYFPHNKSLAEIDFKNQGRPRSVPSSAFDVKSLKSNLPAV